MNSLLLTALLAGSAYASIDVTFSGSGATTVNLQECASSVVTNCEAICAEYEDVCGRFFAHEYAVDCASTCVESQVTGYPYSTVPDLNVPWTCRGYHVGVARQFLEGTGAGSSATTNAAKLAGAEEHCFHAGEGTWRGPRSCPSLEDDCAATPAIFKETQCDKFCKEFASTCDSDVSFDLTFTSCANDCNNREVAYPTAALDVGANSPAWSCRAYHLGVATSFAANDAAAAKAHCYHASVGRGPTDNANVCALLAPIANYNFFVETDAPVASFTPSAAADISKQPTSSDATNTVNFGEFTVEAFDATKLGDVYLKSVTQTGSTTAVVTSNSGAATLTAGATAVAGNKLTANKFSVAVTGDTAGDIGDTVVTLAVCDAQATPNCADLVVTLTTTA